VNLLLCMGEVPCLYIYPRPALALDSALEVKADRTMVSHMLFSRQDGDEVDLLQPSPLESTFKWSQAESSIIEPYEPQMLAVNVRCRVQSWRSVLSV